MGKVEAVKLLQVSGPGPPSWNVIALPGTLPLDGGCGFGGDTIV